MKALVGAFNQEKALAGAFSVITNLRMELFQALMLMYWSSEPERDDRGSDQHRLHLRVAQPAHRRHLLLHHCPLHAPRLLRHILRPPSQCNNINYLLTAVQFI